MREPVDLTLSCRSIMIPKLMSTRLVLLAIAALFLGGLIFFGNRLSTGFRNRFLSIFPSGQNAKPTATPTPVPFGMLATATPQPGNSSTAPVQNPANGNIQGIAQTKGGQVAQPSTPAETIPNTGPEDVAWLLLGASLLSGLFLRKYSLGTTKR